MYRDDTSNVQSLGSGVDSDVNKGFAILDVGLVLEVDACMQKPSRLAHYIPIR